MPGKAKAKKSKQKQKQKPKMKSKPQAPRRRKIGSSGSLLGGAIGRGIGGWLAPGIGGAVGSALGSRVGSALSRISGSGDYKVASNSILGLGPVPDFGVNAVRIRHHEYLGDVFGSTGFTLGDYAINPGNVLAFPWLSTMASNYEQYHFNGLVFEFKSTSASALNSVNTALGKVCMATDYDSADVDFFDVRSMLVTQFSNYGMPANDLLHAIECAPGSTPTNLYYVRTGVPPEGTDIRLYDLGRFSFATEGMQAAANIGGLWVTYDVTFVKPVLGFPAGAVPGKVFSLSGLVGGLFNNPVDLGPTQGNFAMTLVNGPSATMVINSAPVGSVWTITLWVNTGAFSIIGIPLTALFNCTSVVSPLGGQVMLLVQGSHMVATWMISVTGKNPSVALSNLTYQNSPGIQGYLYVNQINSNIGLLPGVPFTPSPSVVDSKQEDGSDEKCGPIECRVTYSSTSLPTILKASRGYEIPKYILDMQSSAAMVSSQAREIDPRKPPDTSLPIGRPLLLRDSARSGSPARPSISRVG